MEFVKMKYKIYVDGIGFFNLELPVGYAKKRLPEYGFEYQAVKLFTICCGFSGKRTFRKDNVLEKLHDFDGILNSDNAEKIIETISGDKVRITEMFYVDVTAVYLDGQWKMKTTYEPYTSFKNLATFHNVEEA